jgi:nitrate reductase gamma subunit
MIEIFVMGGIRMKGLRKSIFLMLLISLFIGFLGSNGWAQEVKVSNDEMNIIDVLIARPLGIVAAAGGTCLFIASLPFTLPTRSVGDSFNMFVVEPWKFSFVREFPDENIY